MIPKIPCKPGNTYLSCKPQNLETPHKASGTHILEKHRHWLQSNWEVVVFSWKRYPLVTRSSVSNPGFNGLAASSEALEPTQRPTVFLMAQKFQVHWGSHYVLHDDMWVFLILEEIKKWDKYMKMETLVVLSDWNCQFGFCLSEDIKTFNVSPLPVPIRETMGFVKFSYF